MIRIVPAFGSCLGHAIALAFGSCLAHAIGVARPRTATADDGRRAPRRQRRAFQGSRIALAVGAITALAATGNPASAAMPPGSCDIADIVQRALPAIVNITVVRVGGSEEAAAGKPDAEHIEVFVGSGSVIDPSGIIVTNKHVIQGAALIRVVFHDKSDVPAQLIAAANLVDLALLKVNLPHPLPTLQFDNSDAARVGQPVIAIGNPLGLGTSVTTGVISALNRDLMRTPFDDFIQTDASINPGNSGGPLLDCAGNMIGVNTALLSNNKLLGSIGLGFALPANDARFVASKLRDPENAMPNWIGLHLQDLTAELAMTLRAAEYEWRRRHRGRSRQPRRAGRARARRRHYGGRREAPAGCPGRPPHGRCPAARCADHAVGVAARPQHGRHHRWASVAAHDGAAQRGPRQRRHRESAPRRRGSACT